MTDNPAVLEQAEAEIKKWGPRRVIINRDGEAVSPERARRLQDRSPDVIFIRNDGWTLGAIKELADKAEALWPDEWIAVLILPGLHPIPYTEYKQLGPTPTGP